MSNFETTPTAITELLKLHALPEQDRKQVQEAIEASFMRLAFETLLTNATLGQTQRLNAARAKGDSALFETIRAVTAEIPGIGEKINNEFMGQLSTLKLALAKFSTDSIITPS